MPIYIALLRAVNVGGHQLIKMDALRTVCESSGLERVKTYVQSGNVVFWSEEKNEAKVAARLQKAIEQSAGFAPDVILRTRAEVESVIARNPFAARKDVPGNKLLVTFFDHEPEREAAAKVNAMKLPPEEFHLLGRELYVFYPQGSGRSKFPVVSIGKTLKAAGTARNWNTVLKLFEMATEAELAG